MNSKRFHRISAIANKLKKLFSIFFFYKSNERIAFQQKYHDGDSVVVPNIFIATFGNFFMKVVLNERLPREKQHILHEYDIFW